jgi:hypothetical protein
MKRRPSEKQIQKLNELIYYAFIELRILGWEGKAEQAAELADAFHNLPTGMFSENFDWDLFRNSFLAAYQERYPREETGRTDYLARFDRIWMDT